MATEVLSYAKRRNETERRDLLPLRHGEQFAGVGTPTLYQRVKPLLDGLMSVVLFVVLSPLLLVVGLLVKFDSPGPALYRQQRVGRNRRRAPGRWEGPDRRQCDLGGQPFTIYKFRTMFDDAERATGAVWAQGPSDPRLTPLGGLLRSSHMDELPQIINVLKGEMSLIGPRPERPELVVELASLVDRYTQRTAVRPGITGLAQVRQHYDATVDDVRRKVEYDLEYIRTAGILLDLRILLATAHKCWGEFKAVTSLGSTARSTAKSG